MELQKILKAQLEAKPCTEETEALQRFQGMLSGREYYRPRDKFDVLVEKLNLSWNAWNSQRHTRAHGSSDEFSTKDLIASSRIAGAINILALAALGYTGQCCISALEDDYIHLSEWGKPK